MTQRAESATKDFIDEQLARLTSQTQLADAARRISEELTQLRGELHAIDEKWNSADRALAQLQAGAQDAARRTSEESVLLRGELRAIGEKWVNADRTLAQLQAGEQRLAMALAIAVIVIGVLLWSLLFGTQQADPRPPVQPPQRTQIRSEFVVHQITSGVFDVGEHDCTLETSPCNTWTVGAGTLQRQESFATAVDHVLKDVPPGSIVLVVEGGHDAKPMEGVGNLLLATMRAYKVRTLLETLVPSKFKPVYISTVRSQSAVPTNVVGDRRVTISLLTPAMVTAVQPQE